MSESERGERIWHPISALPLFIEHISGGLAASREQLAMLEPARQRPYMLDDATVARVIRVFTEQMDDMWLFETQIERWRAEQPNAEQAAGLDRLAGLLEEFKSVDREVLAVAEELEKVTIEKLMAKSDLQVGVEALTGLHHHPPMSGR